MTTPTLLPADTPQPHTPPTLVDPYNDRFKVELFADLTAALGRRPKVFELVMTSGENGFPAGMYVTTGPAGDDRSDRLLHIDESRRVRVVRDGFHSNMSLVFARGPYGEGMLITEPLEMRIQRLLADGTLTTFATLGTAPFGPTGLAYGPDEKLYVTDSTGKSILQVDPDGTSRVFSTAAEDLIGDSWTSVLFIPSAQFGSAEVSFLVGTYNFSEPDTGGVLMVPSDGGAVSQIADESNYVVGGLNGVELLALGPGDVFGSDIYIPTAGGADNADGALYTLSPDGSLTPFMTGLDATSVAFDTEGILGGGMFVADINDGGGGGLIWRITPTENE